MENTAAFLPAVFRDAKYVLLKLSIDRRDQIALYRTLKDSVATEPCERFKLDVTGKRGPHLNLYKPTSDNLRLALRLSMRSIHEWNGFSPSEIIEMSTMCLEAS